MMLFKDYETQKKSITVTCLVITFLLACASAGVCIWQMLMGREPSPSVVWACLGLCSPFVALYWRKRFRASATGIELVAEDSQNAE